MAAASPRSPPVCPPLILMALLAAAPAPLAFGASLNVSPSSGAAGREVMLSSSGFDLDGIGYNTGFYVLVDGVPAGLLGVCPQESRANCSIQVNLPNAAPGTQTIEARNSLGESATDTYQVAEPTFRLAPKCAAPGDTVTATGRFFGVGSAAGIYFDDALIAASSTNFPDESGEFEFSFEIPTASPGEHIVKAQNSFGTVTTQKIYYEIPCSIVGEVTELEGEGLNLVGPGNTLTPLAVGTPIRRSDSVQVPANGGGKMVFVDRTEVSLSPMFVAGQPVPFNVNDLDFTPRENSGPSFFSLLQGVFGYERDGGTPFGLEHGVIDTIFAGLGIRGTAFWSKSDPATQTHAIYLSSGQVSVTPWDTGLTTIHDAPVAIMISSAGVTTSAIPDGDGDGVPDPVDNCSAVANATQRDANGDGYGNICDADLNNSGGVTATDYAILRSVIGQSATSSATAAAADLNGSGSVTATDYAILRSKIGSSPGPSGLVP